MGLRLSRGWTATATALVACTLLHATPTRAQPVFGPSQDPVAGSQLFEQKGCAKCHAINGVGGKIGPDLARIQKPRTFYDLAGGREPLPAEIDGGSLRPLLEDPASGAVKRLMPGLVFHRPLLKAQPHSAFRAGDFKLVITWSGPWQVGKRELFNLAKDIGEQQNLAEAMPGKADEMSATLIAYLKSVNAETAVAATPKKK